MTGGIRVRRDSGWKIERYPQTVDGAKDAGSDERTGLVHAALHLALEDGLDAVGIEEVAERAGVSPESVRQKFGSRDGLTLALLDVVMVNEERV
ncbi:MAG: helix-turn-helix domain-containing protein [Rhodoglobus sp.]